MTQKHFKNLGDIENDIKGLRDLRKDKRQISIKEISLNFYICLKELGYISFEKKFLNSMFNDEDIKQTSQYQIKKEIITNLISDNLIYLGKKEKPYIRFLRKPLLSYQTKKGECVTSSRLSISKSKDNRHIQVYFLK